MPLQNRSIMVSKFNSIFKEQRIIPPNITAVNSSLKRFILHTQPNLITVLHVALPGYSNRFIIDHRFVQ